VKETWTVDFVFAFPDGKKQRIRQPSPVNTRRGAEEHERKLRNALLDGSYAKGSNGNQEEVPTLADFFPRFIEGHSKAEQLKHGTVLTNQSIFNHHLLPALGGKKLDSINTQDVARLKCALSEKTGKTVNCVLSVLSTCLKVAVEWGVIREVPCTITQVKQSKPVPRFYDFEQFDQLVEGARMTGDPRVVALVLLAGEAGLRDGELMELEWRDLDMKRRVITVQRARYKGVVDVPKGGQPRQVEIADRLYAALGALPRHLHQPKVLCKDGGLPATHTVQRGWVEQAERAAGMPVTGGIHVLRHTFCSHLAMVGVPAISIQKVAGHANLQTTFQYMHLSQVEQSKAIAMMDRARAQPAHGTYVAHEQEGNG
jgi:integrase